MHTNRNNVFFTDCQNFMKPSETNITIQVGQHIIWELHNTCELYPMEPYNYMIFKNGFTVKRKYSSPSAATDREEEWWWKGRRRKGRKRRRRKGVVKSLINDEERGNMERRKEKKRKKDAQKPDGKARGGGRSTRSHRWKKEMRKLESSRRKNDGKKDQQVQTSTIRQWDE